MNKTKYLLFVASHTICGAYFFACLVLGYLKLLNTSFVSYSFGPVCLAFIVAQFIIFHDIKPLSPEEAAKYKSK